VRGGAPLYRRRVSCQPAPAVRGRLPAGVSSGAAALRLARSCDRGVAQARLWPLDIPRLHSPPAYAPPARHAAGRARLRAGAQNRARPRPRVRDDAEGARHGARDRQPSVRDRSRAGARANPRLRPRQAKKSREGQGAPRCFAGNVSQSPTARARSRVMRRWKVGALAITQIVELETVGGTRFILPQASTEAIRAIDWLYPHSADENGRLKLTIHSLLVETPTRRILVDTGLGNDKQDRDVPTWNLRQGTFLEDLAAAGYPAGSIDTVLCTHLHVDHVGW